MDERTKERLLKAARIRMHLLEGRDGRLPDGMDVLTALEEGRAAADRLDAELVRRELQRAAVLAESLRMDRDAARAELERLKAEATAAPAIKKTSSSHRYPERACCHCGKSFWPEYFHSAYCSDICKRAAERARREAKAQVDAMHYCERMSLRTLSPLPCGKRVECFGEPRCERCPEDARAVLPPVVSDSWGIGRGLPAGDM